MWSRERYLSDPEYRAGKIRHAKSWNLKNKDRMNEYRKKWSRENPYHNARFAAQRRAATRMAKVEENPAIKGIYKRAQRLRKWFNVVVDHIVPLSRGGNHSPSNLQIIYACENCKKHNSLAYTPAVIFR